MVALQQRNPVATHPATPVHHQQRHGWITSATLAWYAAIESDR
jgi:hypothetical protein